MLPQFCQYFFQYLFKARTRQKLMALAIIGLVISSFALLVLQSSMGGLQNSVKGRSKQIQGLAKVKLFDTTPEFSHSVQDYINSLGANSWRELEVEQLTRHGNFITPSILHGVDPTNTLPEGIDFIGKSGPIIPYEIAHKLNARSGDKVRFIIPSHSNSFLGDIPRMSSDRIEKVISTDVPEVDAYHIWARLAFVQNLVGKRIVNRIVISKASDLGDIIEKLNEKFQKKIDIETWEDSNAALVYALNLENTMMLFLFTSMSLLVSLCIISGLLIFFDKVKTDLASFWILGASQKKIEFSFSLFLHLISILSISVGLIGAFIFLFLMDQYAGEILPDIFVDRKIPILITLKAVVLSFCIPFSISLIFSHITLREFKKEMNFQELIRSFS
jgi:lipoprotein-releasing system permease protein